MRGLSPCIVTASVGSPLGMCYGVVEVQWSRSSRLSEIHGMKKARFCDTTKIDKSLALKKQMCYDSL